MSNHDIEKLVQASIQTKIIEAFNDTPEVIEMLVASALSKEVNEDGRRPDAYGDKKMPYLEFLVGEQIRRCAQNVVKEYIETEANREKIKSAVDHALKSTTFSAGITEAITEIMTKSYRWNIDLAMRVEPDV